jgi:pyruvate/2-oxoglutarate dehydrogenase complex dihydrolipoamide acyltransferase (E2) component
VAHELRLPDLGEGLPEGEVARWLVSEGDAVAEGDPVVEIQTDKTTVELPSPLAGIVLMILAAEGEVVPVGATLVVIGEAGEQLLRSVRPLPAEEHAPGEPLVVVGDEPLEAARATPDVRQLARRLGVDLLTVRGSGLAGRITERDVRAARATAAGAGRRVPIRGIRRAIVEQVERTHREIPAVTFVEECDFTGADESLLVATALKAAAESLRAFPELNSRIEGDEIVLLERYDLGVAVQTAAGLVVPVVRGCDGLSVGEIDAEVRRLAEGAHAGVLQGEELRDSTFTVTSAGKLGGLFATPLINHPEVAILGLHRIAPRAVVRDGAVVVRQIGHVSVTFDHRVVDGVQAAEFCLDVIGRLQASP